MTKCNATSAACSNGDTLAYDVENRLTQVVKGATTTNFAYNGDGTRVKRGVSNAGTTYYIGNYYEVWVPNSGTTTFNKFYYFGTQRVAAKIAGTLFYFQGDHLGSSSVVMTSAGTSFYTRQTYFPYGAPRTTEGSALPADYTFTGQKNDDSTGLMDSQPLKIVGKQRQKCPQQMRAHSFVDAFVLLFAATFQFADLLPRLCPFVCR